MEGMSEEERFLYGTHYSTPAYVIYWLLRAMPERMLRLHNGHFDTWPRLFRSVLESWESVNESTASLMELIPEFFVLPATWLENTLGIITAEGPLTDVQLPSWAVDVTDFVCKMRAALESDWVSEHLPAWIDLIFGYKQSGEEADKADNLFHPVCYTGSRNGHNTSTTGISTAALETQLQEFGRVPHQLFQEAHPPRLKVPPWGANKLKEDPLQSEPWYKVVRHISKHSLESLEALHTGDQEDLVNGGAVCSSATATPVEQKSGPVVCGLTSAAMQGLVSHAVAPLAASGRITGIASCVVNLYSIGEDGCLRVSPLSAFANDNSSAMAMASMRRNFRISPMPLSALAVLRTDLLAIGGHDNALTLYSSSRGTALAKYQVHADTVSCLGVSPC